MHARRFGTFMCNCDKERYDLSLYATTASLWAHLIAEKDKFINLEYTFTEQVRNIIIGCIHSENGIPSCCFSLPPSPHPPPPFISFSLSLPPSRPSFPSPISVDSAYGRSTSFATTSRHTPSVEGGRWRTTRPTTLPL